jgi:hypothetical protein
MYPHERSLVKRLEGKPFALVGINSDSDKGALKKVMEKEKITWRTWWDGGSTDGFIQRAYNISSWPTIYVLDHRGLIRYKNVRDTKLDEAVDALLKQIPNHELGR